MWYHEDKDSHLIGSKLGAIQLRLIEKELFFTNCDAYDISDHIDDTYDYLTLKVMDNK